MIQSSICLLLLFVFLSISVSSSDQYLRLSTPFDNNIESGKLVFANREVFLNGMNLAWFNYGEDFNMSVACGYGAYTSCSLANATAFVKANGGNAMRVWLFAEPSVSGYMHTANDGTVTGLADGVIDGIRLLLQTAKQNGILIVLSLWNGALVRHQKDCDIFSKASITQSILDTVIAPMAKALANETALAMWEIINEPEGIVNLASKGHDSCTDLTAMTTCPGSANGCCWNKDKGGICNFPILTLQKFINLNADTLRKHDPNHLITSSTWSVCAMSDSGVGGSFNYWSDTCLVKAGGATKGTLDIPQLHAYPKDNDGKEFHPHDVFSTNASAYNLPATPFIGEISNRWSNNFDPHVTTNITIAKLYETIYNNGYSGILGWSWTCLASQDEACIPHKLLAEGMQALAKKKDVRNVDILKTLETTSVATDLPQFNCHCSSNKPPDGRYTCGQQAMWGKCLESFMHGYCDGWCRLCK